METENIYKQAIDKFGLSAQQDMLIEEMAELTQAILKLRRGKDGAYENMHEEFADVTILMKQIETRLDKSILNDYIFTKTARLQRLVTGS